MNFNQRSICIKKGHHWCNCDNDNNTEQYDKKICSTCLLHLTILFGFGFVQYIGQYSSWQVTVGAFSIDFKWVKIFEYAHLPRYKAHKTKSVCDPFGARDCSHEYNRDNTWCVCVCTRAVFFSFIRSRCVYSVISLCKSVVLISCTCLSLQVSQK